jgi:lipid A 3-O-deacylase
VTNQIFRTVTGLAAVAAAWLATPAQAADLVINAPYAPITVPIDPANRFEARFGAFAHGIGGAEEGSVDLNGELVSPRLFNFGGPWAFLAPRVHVGGLVNLSGRTSIAYTGLLWTIPVFDRFFVEGFVGPAVHNGELSATATHAGLGCRTLFNAGGSVGYRFSDQWSLMATFDHVSNGKSLFGVDCGTNQAATGSNQGLNNYGVRVGYTF